MAQKENRKHLRVPVDWPVVILDGTGACNARLKDISANGAFVVSDIPIQPRKQLTLFIIPDNHRTIRAMSEVVRLHINCSHNNLSSCGIGMRFTRVSSADRQTLKNAASKTFKAKKASLSKKRGRALLAYLGLQPRS